ncbi:hypothetical protein U9M48_001524 [Paspalum notatum var. saurae]|uniref:Retroviral polymerase SH3-like domain-containing protein n=1 Tax=Paspalum notatum var. saurae TaxID=547442 RepID=A0AAQ3SID7_PASNO
MKKLDDRSTPAIFIGYEAGAKAWRFYDPATRCVIISRDAVFDEGKAWDWGAVSHDVKDGVHGSEFVLEHSTEELAADDPGAHDIELEAPALTPRTPDLVASTPPGTAPGPGRASPSSPAP